MPTDILNRFYLVTLSLEDAIIREDWEMITPLLDVRDALLSELVGQVLDEEAYNLAVEADRRCHSRLFTQSERLAAELKKTFRQTKAASIYKKLPLLSPKLLEKSG